MPKYVRRAPLLERVKTYLNPYDFLLWLSEEIDTNGWDQLEKSWAMPIAATLNFTFILARANVTRRSKDYDDVFGDARGQSWVAWLAAAIVYTLTVLSIFNAIYTFWRKKHYRLFESPVETVLSTPSAHRVKIDSSPVSSSPLRFLSSILGTESASSRAHPDSTNDVWELAVWDPLPISLQLFCYFSPGHVIVYWLFLPTLSSDPRPSTTVVTAMALCLILTTQLFTLTSRFSQQGKDTSLISKEVLNEYDIKYVRPRTQPLYRDVGTQFTEQASYSEQREATYNTVDTYVPAVVINRGFHPNPNPNYIAHVNPDANSNMPNLRRQTSTPSVKTPAPGREPASLARPLTAIKQPNFRPSSSKGDGGSLGVYSHAASPLRKSASTNFSPAKIYSNDMPRERITHSPERRSRVSAPSANFGVTTATQRLNAQLNAGRRESGRF